MPLPSNIIPTQQTKQIKINISEYAGIQSAINALVAITPDISQWPSHIFFTHTGQGIFIADAIPTTESNAEKFKGTIQEEIAKIFAVIHTASPGTQLESLNQLVSEGWQSSDTLYRALYEDIMELCLLLGAFSILLLKSMKPELRFFALDLHIFFLIITNIELNTVQFDTVLRKVLLIVLIVYPIFPPPPVIFALAVLYDLINSKESVVKVWSKNKTSNSLRVRDEIWNTAHNHYKVSKEDTRLTPALA